MRVIGTGRSDFANQINNVLAFPGVFKGALSVRARDINTAMKVAAAHAIADLVSDEERSEDYIIPGHSIPVWRRPWRMRWQKPPGKRGWPDCERDQCPDHHRNGDPPLHGVQQPAFRRYGKRGALRL